MNADARTQEDVNADGSVLLRPAARPISGFPAFLNTSSIILSFVGIFVAGVLSLGHLLARTIPCGDEAGGCNIIATNPASLLFGIPIAYLGFGAYVCLALLSSIRGVRGLGRTTSIGTIALVISGVGALFSFYLQFISYSQIHALCYWCLTSALVMCFLFLAQAALAQSEVPIDYTKNAGGIVMPVGLALLAALGLGYEMLVISHRPSLRMIAGNEETIRLLLTPDSMRYGNDEAPIKIVEFSDLVCPSCKAEYTDVKNLINTSKGKIQLVLRHRPLTHNPEHKMAFLAAFIAEYGAEKGKGWPFVDAMYEHDNAELQTQDAILRIAQSVGIDTKEAMSRFKDTDPDYIRVQRDLNAAIKINVIQTPTFVVFARGLPPVPAAGFDLFSVIKQPEYQVIINGK